MLIVGGFPGSNNKIYGGIVTSCTTLLSSSFSQKFEVLTIDSTQKSNPIPPLIIRLFFAGIRTLSYLLKLILQRPKVVILFSSMGASLVEKGLMSWMAFFLRIPVFMFPRGGGLLDQVEESPFTRFWVKWAFGGASKVLCQGPAWQTFAIETLNFSKNECPIIFNWTATDRLLSIGAIKVKTKINRPLNIIYLGWLEEEKGIFDLLEACSEITQENKFRISIAGGGSCENEAKELVRKRGMQDLVTFFGWIEGAQLEELLNNSDILVLPSWAEGFPNAVLESCVVGTPVIAFNVPGGTKEIISNGINGFLVDTENEFINQLNKDMNFEPKKIRTFVQEKFNKEKILSEYEKMFTTIIN